MLDGLAILQPQSCFILLFYLANLLDELTFCFQVECLSELDCIISHISLQFLRS